jgi:hypothetical protein
MKMLLGAALGALAMLVLMLGAQSAFALTQFQSGYKHGCDDVDKLPDTRYINSIGHEASHHTTEFMNGYHQGFKACGGSKAEDSSDFPDLKPGQHYGTCEEKEMTTIWHVTF